MSYYERIHHLRVAQLDLNKFLHNRSPLTISLIGTVLLFFLGFIDYLSGKELSFSVFYLFPIYIMTWYGGPRLGILAALASSVAWLFAEMFEGRSYSHPMILYWNSLVRLGFFLITRYILSELKVRLSLEESLAGTDSLTDMANRRTFYRVAQDEMVRAGRTGRPFSVAYFDLDNFKMVNDRFGHQAGDELLRLVAGSLKAHIRRLDTAARLGGDEFTILLPETNQEAAREFLTRLKAIVMEAIREPEWPVTVSMGVVTYFSPPPDVDTILRKADGMMYLAKKEGKDAIRYDVYPSPLEERIPADPSIT